MNDLPQLESVPVFRADKSAHLWVSIRGISDAGDAAWLIALTWTAVQIGSPVEVGLVLSAGSLPRLLLLIWGGAMADRYSPRRIMVIVNIVRAVLLAACFLLFLFVSPTIILLCLIGVFLGGCDALYKPAASTISRQLVRRSDLPLYGGAMLASSRIGWMAGSALGGWLVSVIGLSGAAAVNAFTFMSLALFVALRLRPRFALPRSPMVSMWVSVGDGFQHLRSNRTTRNLVLGISAVNLAVAPGMAIGVALQSDRAEWGPSALGFLAAVTAAGTLIGAIVMLWWHPKCPALLGFLAFTMQSVTLSLLALGELLIALIAVGAIGLCTGIGSVLLGSAFTSSTAPAFLGRMNSIMRMGDDCFRPLVLGLFGFLSGQLGLAPTFLICSAILAIISILPLSDKHLRRISLEN